VLEAIAPNQWEALCASSLSQGSNHRLGSSLAFALTKRANEAYDDYIGRVLENELACRVKLADLQDNMDLSRISQPTEEHHQSLEKYRRAAERLSKAFPPSHV